MSSIATATAAVASNQAQVQLAVAAKIAKSNANAGQAVSKLIEAASENLQQIVEAANPPGVGGSLDIRV